MGNIGSGQSPLSNLVFAHEGDTLLLFGILDKILEKLNASRNARYTVMRADRHHPSAGGSLGIEDFEIVLQVV